MRVQNEIAFEIPKTSKRISATFSPAVVRQSLLQNKLWYHGKCNREQSQHKLKLHGLKKGYARSNLSIIYIIMLWSMLIRCV